MKKTIRKKNLITPERVATWTDEEVLTNLSTLLTRASISTEFVSEDLDEGTILTHEVMCAMSGDKAIFSEPRPLDWPLQMMPMPEAFQKSLN
jgi:hypothetical protein